MSSVQKMRRESNIGSSEKNDFFTSIIKKDDNGDYKYSEGGVIEIANIPDEITKDKIVGCINGCYCPPHKGHFKTWQNACKDLNLDVLCIGSINKPYKTEEYHRTSIEDKNKKKKIQPSYTSRHGIPLEFTEWVVSQWSKELKNREGKPVHIVFSILLPNSFIENNFKQLYLIQGNEGEGDETSDVYKESLTTLKEKNKDDLNEPYISYWGRKNGITNEKLNNNNKYPMWRISYKNYWRDTRKTGNPADSPSATKFSLCIKNIKEGKKNASECFSFLPDFMPSFKKQEYIEKVIEEYYTDTAHTECIKFYKNVKKDDDSDVAEKCDKYNFTQSSGGKRIKPHKNRKTRKTRKTRKPKRSKNKLY